MRLFFLIAVMCCLASCKYGHIDYSKYNDVSISKFPIESHYLFPVSMRDQVKSISTVIGSRNSPNSGRFLCVEYTFTTKDSLSLFIKEICGNTTLTSTHTKNYIVFQDINLPFDGLVIYSDSLPIPFFTFDKFNELHFEDELSHDFETFVLGMKHGRLLPPDELIKDDFIPGKFNHGASWGVTVNESRLVVLSWVTMW